MAHARRSFRGRGISDSQRRKKSWIQLTGPTTEGGNNPAFGTTQTPNIVLPIAQVTPVSDSQGSSVGLLSDPVLDKVPAESTILRIRGSINLPKNMAITDVVTNYAFGFGVMEATAAALGAFPNPATPDGGAWDGWMFYRSQQAGALDANATLFDVKAMRKVQSGQAIIAVFGSFTATVSGATVPVIDGVQVEFNARALILLP